MKLAQNLAQTKEKLCKVIPKYAENVNKNTITEILQNCCKCRKYSKIKHFRRFNIDDKNTICIPRHSSFMIMHTFADWGNTGQNKAESIENTTVSTTKAHARNVYIAKETATTR